MPACSRGLTGQDPGIRIGTSPVRPATLPRQNPDSKEVVYGHPF